MISEGDDGSTSYQNSEAMGGQSWYSMDVAGALSVRPSYSIGPNQNDDDDIQEGHCEKREED